MDAGTDVGVEPSAGVSGRPPRIRLLPPELVEQIAAGEVVDRPASVVKELVENALDAGATRVEVEVEGGGRKLVRVADDGCGMTVEEARLAVQRHATSKIAAADDLWALTTFGFRGEALPAIAAVSRLTLITRPRERTAGFRLSLAAGREEGADAIGAAVGTQIEVRDLFFNVPARLKFLKTEATEAATVAETVLRLALAHPAVHVRLRSNGRVTLDLPPHRDRSQRVRTALARRGADALHEAAGEEGACRVWAYLGDPALAAATARSTFLFVGGRAVRDRGLLNALGAGYGELLERGRYPLAALFVDVSGDGVDVNVHPQKLEVRFARPQEVYGAVRHVVGAAVARAPWLAARPLYAHTLPPAARPDVVAVPAFARPSRAADGEATSGAPSTRGALVVGEPPSRAAEPETRAPGELTPPLAGVIDPGGAPAAGGARGFFSSLDYIGQLQRTYLLCEGGGELVLIDQHAAHERIAFQRLRQAYRARTVSRQRLLFPMPIPLVGRAALDAAARAALAELGFEVDDLGPDTVVLRTVPEVLRDADPKPVLLDVIDRLGDGGAAATEDALDRVLSTMACHSVVRAGDVLRREQVLSLLAQLDGVDLRSHCPHGRPVLLRMPVAELERRFGRT